MSNVNNVGGASVLDGLSAQQNQQDAPKSNELGQSAFLELMITQLNNQNPLDPQDNSEFVAQLAQFSSVEGIERLNNTMDTVSDSFQSSQALQASAMVGRMVRVPATEAPLTGNRIITGSVELEQSTSQLQINIYNSTGQLVNQYAMGAQAAGDFEFAWDGSDQSGNALPEGIYRFEALADVDGESEAVTTTLSTNVNSVTISKAGELTLNLNGMEPAKMSDIRQIM